MLSDAVAVDTNVGKDCQIADFPSPTGEEVAHTERSDQDKEIISQKNNLFCAVKSTDTELPFLSVT